MSLEQKIIKKISIMVQTYNHERFIAQCLQSIIDQKTEYDFEINVIEDCSTDNTREVIMEFKKKYPDIINLYFNEKNLGHIRTQIVTYSGFKTLNGEYIAMIEGDDYWNDNKKLQKQISFLEKNPDFVGCGHTVKKVFENQDKKSEKFNYWGDLDVLDINDCIRIKRFLHFNCSVYRNIFKKDCPKFLSSKYACDLLYPPFFARYGKIKYFDEVMSVYRAHEGGCFSNKEPISMYMYEIDSLIRYNRWLKYLYCNAYSEYILHRIYHMFDSAKKDKVKVKFLKKLKFKYLCIYFLLVYNLSSLILIIKNCIFYQEIKRKRTNSDTSKKGFFRILKQGFDNLFPFMEMPRRFIGKRIKACLKIIS